MLNSVEMALHGFNHLAGVVLVVGMSFMSDPAVSGEELSHPSLVDPAITKCAVCHASVEMTHPEGASNQDCLGCHTLVKRSKKTIVIVDDRRLASTSGRPPAEALTAGSGVTESEPTAGQAAGNTPSDPPQTGPADEGTVDGPAQPSAAPTEPNRPASVAPPPAGGGADDVQRLYKEGLAAFIGGDHDRAFQTWAMMMLARPDHYALQVEVDTYLESAQSTVADYTDSRLYVVVKDGLHWVFSGLFATHEEAAEALKSLPEPLRRGGAFPIAVREIIPRQ